MTKISFGISQIDYSLNRQGSNNTAVTAVTQVSGSKTQLENMKALAVLHNSLITGGTEDASGLTTLVEESCTRHNIQPCQLPISPEYPGNLSQKQLSDVFADVTSYALPSQYLQQ